MTYGPRLAVPRGGYRRKKLRCAEQQVVDLLRERSFASVYNLAKALNSFGAFKTVRGLVRVGLIAKEGTRPVLTEKALHLNDAPFYVPTNATQRFVPIETTIEREKRDQEKQLTRELRAKEAERYAAAKVTRATERETKRLRKVAEREARHNAHAARRIQERPLAVERPLPIVPAAPFDIRDFSGEQRVLSEPLKRPHEERSRRVRAVRARTISIKRITKRDLQVGKSLYPPEVYWRPSTRGECVAIQRPCPFVSCRFHLFLDISPETGAIKLNFPDLEPDEMGTSCVLDVSDRGGETLEFVAQVTNITRERIRQIEAGALIQLRRSRDLEEHDEGERTPVRAFQRRTA